MLSNPLPHLHLRLYFQLLKDWISLKGFTATHARNSSFFFLFNSSSSSAAVFFIYFSPCHNLISNVISRGFEISCLCHWYSFFCSLYFFPHSSYFSYSLLHFTLCVSYILVLKKTENLLWWNVSFTAYVITSMRTALFFLYIKLLFHGFLHA